MPTIKPNRTDEIISKIFKGEETAFGLKEFKTIDLKKVLYITKEEQSKFYVRDIKSKKLKMVFDDKNQKGRPEEIIRQLWLYKLTNFYKYPLDRIDTEKSVHFGTKEYARADIIVYKKDKITPYLIFELKSPSAKKGIDQLKSYISAEGSEIGVWSNGNEKVVLYRPYPKEFEDSLTDIPRADQTIDDLFEIKRTWSELKHDFDFIEIVKRIEELALAGSGANVFEEIFKIIYAKLYDEKLARERREREEVLFRKYRDPEKTYDIINNLFKKAAQEWPDTFEPSDRIRISPERLNVCVPFLENVRLFEIGKGELEIIDSAFEYLITEVSKGKKGQYFTPRHVIKMCVKMMQPKENEYLIDPACGSGGFLLHTMYHIWDDILKNQTAQKDYAGKYLFGLDFDDNMRRISQALMLIAGDGKHHIFKRNSLDARDWQGVESEEARVALKPLLTKFLSDVEDKQNQLTYRYFNFDILLTNPPFAGENPDAGLLRQYELAKKNGKLKNNVERHILFIERALDFLRPGGRLAIVLPQGVLNNTNMEYVREYLFEKARILAVIGLHGNTFKPHTGTKTSVLFLQKWGGDLPAEGPPKEEASAKTGAGEPLRDYPIFMAVSKKAGKDNSGEYVYKKDAKGNFVHDEKGRKTLDHDLDKITEEFIKFAKKEKFSFV
ncbi:MAG: N-6 DNA methylase [Candidatus Doudnabacteria bacterium]